MAHADSWGQTHSAVTMYGGCSLTYVFLSDACVSHIQTEIRTHRHTHRNTHFPTHDHSHFPCDSTSCISTAFYVFNSTFIASWSFYGSCVTVLLCYYAVQFSLLSNPFFNLIKSPNKNNKKTKITLWRVLFWGLSSHRLYSWVTVTNAQLTEALGCETLAVTLSDHKPCSSQTSLWDHLKPPTRSQLSTAQLHEAQ